MGPVEGNKLSCVSAIYSFIYKYFKMKSFRSLLAIVTIVIISMTSCSKTGDTGPAGPAGPDSVYSSHWIVLAPEGYLDGNSDSAWDQTIAAASITKAILDSGMILSYVNIGDPSKGEYFVKDVSSLSNVLYEDFSVGSLYLQAFSDFSGLPFRYVTIPGKLLSGNGAQKKYKGYTIQELKSMGYDKVQQVVADKN